MSGRRSHVPAVLLAGALAVTVLAGCNASAGGGGADSSSGGNEHSFILVTPEPVGVNEFLKLAVTGVKQAAKDLKGSSKVFQSQDPTNIQQQVDAAIAEKPDVLAVVGFEFADSIAAAATANPKQQFLFVDACTAKQFPNVTCAVFREHEAVFLAGVEAGMLTKTKQVGAVVALDTPQIRRFSDPFGAGAKKADPAVGFTPQYVGGQNPFNDPARAKEQALALVAKKADMIMASAAAGNLGVFDAAKSGNFEAFGVDVNQCPVAPGHIVDNVVKQVDKVTADSIAKIVDGKGGSVVSYGLKEGGVTLTGLQDGVDKSQCLIADHADVISEVKKIRDQIVSGDLTVDDPAQG